MLEWINKDQILKMLWEIKFSKEIQIFKEIMPWFKMLMYKEIKKIKETDKSCKTIKWITMFKYKEIWLIIMDHKYNKI